MFETLASQSLSKIFIILSCTHSLFNDRLTTAYKFIASQAVEIVTFASITKVSRPCHL